MDNNWRNKQTFINQDIVQTTNRNGGESHSGTRILRHNNPLIIIPFFTGTREEELVDKMLANYNPDLIVKLFKSQITKEVLEEILNGKGNIQQIVSG